MTDSTSRGPLWSHLRELSRMHCSKSLEKADSGMRHTPGFHHITLAQVREKSLLQWAGTHHQLCRSGLPENYHRRPEQAEVPAAEAGQAGYCLGWTGADLWTWLQQGESESGDPGWVRARPCAPQQAHLNWTWWRGWRPGRLKQLQPAAGGGHGAQPAAAAALTSAAAAGQAAVEAAVVAAAAAAEAARPTAAHLGERPATGSKLDTKAGTGTGSAISTPGTVGPMATTAEDSRGEAVGVTTDTGQATTNSTAGSTAIVAAAAEWLK